MSMRRARRAPAPLPERSTLHVLRHVGVRGGSVRVWALLRDAARKFYADDCPTLAAAISFYALLSLIPVLFLVIAILGYVVGSSQETFQAVLASVREFIPHLSEDFTRNLEWVVDNRGRLSWLGLGESRSSRPASSSTQPSSRSTGCSRSARGGASCARACCR